MFAMSQHQYAYAAAPPAPRQYSGHGTSSAFSSSANPDEDWTKISDLAERRRIQNRIAQRNYRKKLKRRLEDLERRAGTSDGASSSSGPEKSQTSKASSNATKRPQTTPRIQQQQQQQQQQRQQQQQPQQQKQQPAPVVAAPPPKPIQQQGQFTPPMHHDDEYLFQTTPYDERDRTHSPPMFTYSTYPPPDDMLLPPYGATQPTYRPMAATTEPYPDYLGAATTVPVTLPPMTHFSDAIKREPGGFGQADDTISPYLNYGSYLPGLDMGAPSPYDQHSNPHTPPLSHSFDHSANCSDSGYEYPTTPLSMPGSPGQAWSNSNCEI